MISHFLFQGISNPGACHSGSWRIRKQPIFTGSSDYLDLLYTNLTILPAALCPQIFYSPVEDHMVENIDLNTCTDVKVPVCS